MSMLPAEISSLVLGDTVPMPTLPFNTVFVMLSLPKTTLLEPTPVASYPITISFVSPSARAFVLYPRKVLLYPVAFAVAPSVI